MEPFFKDDEGWWFWDETETKALGPCPTKEAASKASRRYFESISGTRGSSPKGIYIHLMEKDDEI